MRSIMLAGTGSDVGKSVIATALCRIFLQDGYHPAPFKAQNMALNSYATPDGLEIGRAQAEQAAACGLPPHTDMNPLLLKPNSDHTSQVVLNGKPIGNKSAYEFWNRPTPDPIPEQSSPTRSLSRQGGEPSGSEEVANAPATPLPDGRGQGVGLDFRSEVHAAYSRLAAKYNPIVMEGAGSVSELNLRDHDLVNLPMARYADAAVILVADIDRGGVFASCYGSIKLQTPEDQQRIKGIIINKFRGDLRLFDEGRRMLEEVCGVPVLGVVPYFKDIYIEEEDSVALERKTHPQPLPSGRGALRLGRSSQRASYPPPLREGSGGGSVSIAVVLLRHISNFTDFNVLERDPRVNLFYTNNVDDISRADIIILPGTKATLDDLMELRRNGCAQAIQRAHRDGKMIVGICGGYQMLGQTLNDPNGIEGSIPCLPGLGLLPIHTTMTAEKTTRQVTFEFNGQTCQGYEIHQGVSDTSEAIIETDHCIGTYIHGFLDNAPVIEHILQGKAHPQPLPIGGEMGMKSPAEFKEEQYDKLAAHVRQYVDIPRLYDILNDK